MNYDEYQAGVTFWKVFPVLFIVLGTIGNILSIFILCRKNIRKSTCAFYLIVLAVSDLVVLYSGLLRQWINTTFHADIRQVSDGMCKFNTWLVYMSLDFSAWILVAVTAERVALVWFPHSAKSKCTKRSAAWIIGSILLFLMGINGHILYGLHLVTTSVNGTTIDTCTFISDDYEYFFDNAWPWIDFSIFCGLPFSCLLTGNILIITKVISSQRSTRRQISPQDPKSQGGSQKSPVSSMSIMLFTLNSVFLLCTTPVSIYLIGYSYWHRGATAYDKAVLSFSWAFVNFLMYLNNTFNFFLYCLSGTRFRNEVKCVFLKMIGRDKNHSSLERQQQQMRHDITSRSNIPGTPRSRSPHDTPDLTGSRTRLNGSRMDRSSPPNRNFLSVDRLPEIKRSSHYSLNDAPQETSEV